MPFHSVAQPFLLICALAAPLTLTAGPAETARMKAMIAETAKKVGQPGIAYAEERLAFHELERAIEQTPLTPAETAEVLGYARSHGYDEALATRHYENEIEAEKIQSAADQDLTNFSMHRTDAALAHIRSELGLLPPGDRPRLLFIGAGALPYSALFAQKILGEQVAICDSDTQALELAENFIRQLGLSDRFTFVHGEATQINLSPFNIIWMAAMARPKLAILANPTLPDCARILVRQTVGLGQLLYGPRVDFSVLPFLEQAGTTGAGKWSSFETIFLRVRMR